MKIELFIDTTNKTYNWDSYVTSPPERQDRTYALCFLVDKLKPVTGMRCRYLINSVTISKYPILK